MPWRGSIKPFAGLLDEYEGVAHEVYEFDAANTLTKLTIRVTDPPVGGTVVIRLWNNEEMAGAEGTAYLEATIADGETFATVTGSVATGASLWQEIVTGVDDDAMNLSGEYEMITASGISQYFTTLALVKLDLKETGTSADRDSVLNAQIAAVTRQMQDYMKRDIVQGTATAEKIDSRGADEIYTEHYPIIDIASIAEDGTALVEDTDFESLEGDLLPGRIVRIDGVDGEPTAWADGRRKIKITYDHGYANVPDSLVAAATSLVATRFQETKQGGGWRGINTKGVEPNATTLYDKRIWEREVIPAMLPYRRSA